ncbi:MAG: hypothetical protein ACE5GE_04900, partial [Phycisphaerae bacterium]
GTGGMDDAGTGGMDDAGTGGMDDAGTGGMGGSGVGGGSAELRAALTGSGLPSGNAKYRLDPDRERFTVEVEDATPGTAHDIAINGEIIGQITVGALGTAEVEFDTNLEPGKIPLPDNFPAEVNAGDNVTVGDLISGSMVVVTAP